MTESKYLKREFGEPLPTFNGVMKQHQVNKLKEDWWDDMSANQQSAYIKDHPGSKQAKSAKDKEKKKEGPKELEKGAKVTASWTGVSGDEQSIPDGEIEGVKYKEDGTVDSYNIRWNNGNNLINLSADKVSPDDSGSEPEDKPHGGDTGKDADSEKPKSIADAAEEVQDAIGYIHTDTKDGQELHDLMSQETLSTKEVIRAITLTGRSTHGAGPEGAKKMDNFAQSKLEISDEEQKQNAPLGQKIAKATNGNPEDLKFVGVRSVKDKDGNSKAARSFYDKSDGMMMAVDSDGNVYENGKQASTGYKIKDSYDPKLGETKMNESIKMHTISGNKRFMTKTALPIMKKYGVKNVRANSVGGYFLELRFQIDSRKLKELDKELKRKNKTAYGGIVENRKISIDRRDKMKEDVLRKVIREEIKRMIKEDEESFSQPIPATIDRYMKKFIDAVARGNLNRKRKLAILGRTIVALRLDPQEVSKYARLVKREL